MHPGGRSGSPTKPLWYIWDTYSCLVCLFLLLHYSETFNSDLPHPSPLQIPLRTVNNVSRNFKVLAWPARVLSWGSVAQILHGHCVRGKWGLSMNTRAGWDPEEEQTGVGRNSLKFPALSVKAKGRHFVVVNPRSKQVLCNQLCQGRKGWRLNLPSGTACSPAFQFFFLFHLFI